jgi:hypothetical protein
MTMCDDIHLGFVLMSLGDTCEQQTASDHEAEEEAEEVSLGAAEAALPH